ncbi:MAG: ATPase, T2SS/T4P/T4SS family [Planctomycetota bacterium]
MNTKQIVKFLQTVQLFHELDQEQLTRLAKATREVRFSSGELICESSSGDPALYVLLEGECVEYVEQPELGMDTQSQWLYAGNFFGLESVLLQRTAAFRVAAVEAGRAIRIGREVIADLFESSPAFTRAVCRALAARLHRIQDMVKGIRFVQLQSFPHIESVMHLLPQRVASVTRSLVVDEEGDRVTVAMVNPSDIRARSFIEDVLRDYHVQFVAVSEEDFEERGRSLLGERLDSVAEHTPFEDMSYQDSNGVLRPLAGSREDDFLSRLLTVALRRGASDVHFEPYQGRARVRLRVDGRMVLLNEDIPAIVHRQLIVRIKILSELDTTRIRRPLDGRFLIQADDHPIEFRVSASPCHGGEKIVLRIVAPSKQYGNLSRLILYPWFEKLARELFSSPSGLVLVTGPSGAGKTTTLYAALQSVVAKDTTKNIVTIEDPVEYDLPFATQIQVNHESGMDFAKVLKSVLRQDPDVILVGEIRDPESAAMAAEAATTGHLVLSSLHTYSALEAIVRLRDLKVPPYVITAGLQGVITQQLLPRLEPGWTKEVPKDDPIMAQLSELGVLDGEWDQPLLRGRSAAGGPAGGESGRVAIYEALAVTPTLNAAIDRSAPISELRECLDPTCSGSFPDYARFLLKEGIVAPERIVDMLPRVHGRMRYDRPHGVRASLYEPSRVARNTAPSSE